jgi:hypothetical protein
MMIFLASPIMTGCDFSFYFSEKLQAPEISLNEENKVLLWDSVKNATHYDIYCNEKLADTIEATDTEIVSYELIPLLKEYWFDEPIKVKDWTNNLRSAIK